MYEWKKAEKAWYGTGADPVELELPAWGSFVIEGEGDPNGPDFAARVEALYAAAYTVRMAPKSGLELPGWFEYTVYPLEGLWTLKSPPVDGTWTKDQLAYRLVIHQPSFLTPPAADQALAAARRKKKLVLLSEVRFVEEPAGRFAQILHRGPYDTEPASFRRLEDWCRKQSLARVGHDHREIYLSDPRKTAPEDRKTLLRVPVRDHFSCD